MNKIEKKISELVEEILLQTGIVGLKYSPKQLAKETVDTAKQIFGIIEGIIPKKERDDGFDNNGKEMDHDELYMNYGWNLCVKKMKNNHIQLKGE